MITVLILLVAVGVLVWGWNRARLDGKAGILAWLQSVMLMAPWLIVFSLFTFGVYLNIVAILLILLISTIGYIVLGNRLRALGPDALPRRQSWATKQAGVTPDADGEGTQGAASTNPNAANATNAGNPTSGVPEVAQIPAADLDQIRGIFGIDTFYATDTIPYMDGAIFRGNLRGEPDQSHQRLTLALEKKLGDRYRLFFVNGPDDRPTVVVLPSSNDPKPSTVYQKGLAIALALVTVATCFEASGIVLGFDLFSAPDRWLEPLGMAIGLIVILASHEIAHGFMARRHGVRLSFPFFLPTWQLGSLGAFTRFESLLPNRNVLFDIAFIGPAVGGLMSFILLIAGLSLSHQGGSLPLQSDFFQGSILVGVMARAILGDAVQQPYVEVHPWVVIGWLGLVINAINLMPAGQLDGGRIVQSVYGRKVAGRSTIVTLLILGIATLVNPLALYWAVVILFLQRDLERPSLNELTEPDDTRAALALLALFLMIATLLPLSPGLAGRLGIGG